MSAQNRALLVTLLLLGGCAVGPDYQNPTPPALERYGIETDPILTAPAEGVAQHFTLGGKIVTDWWRLFKSPKLDALINDAMAHNPSIAAADASLRRSQNNLRAGYGIFYPQIEGDAEALRQRYSGAKLGERAPASVFNLFTLGASVSYALDVFGGERRLVEQLGAERDVSEANREAVYLTLWTNIVNGVIASSAYRAEIDATLALIRSMREQIDLTGDQVTAGTAPYSALLALRQQLGALQASLPPLEQLKSHSDMLLATLSGHNPSEWTPPPIRLEELNLPADLPVSLPAELVAQRPDLKAASAVAHDASANIGVATAALLPSFSLTGTIGGNASQTSQLLAKQAQFWSFGAGAVVPIFNGFTLWYQRKAALDAYDQAMALYRQTLLAAILQVGDCLHALDHDADALQAEGLARASADESLQLIDANFQAGLVNQLAMLNAQSQRNQIEIVRLQLVALRYQDTVALFAALGGGWWHEDLH